VGSSLWLRLVGLCRSLHDLYPSPGWSSRCFHWWLVARNAVLATCPPSTWLLLQSSPSALGFGPSSPGLVRLRLSTDMGSRVHSRVPFRAPIGRITAMCPVPFRLHGFSPSWRLPPLKLSECVSTRCRSEVHQVSDLGSSLRKIARSSSWRGSHPSKNAPRR
jgi:hypothetical protein